MKECSMRKLQQEQSATREKRNIKRVEHEESASWKKGNAERVQHGKIVK